MTEDILARIQELITQLEAAKSGFVEGTQGFEQLSAGIALLNSVLSDTTGITNLASYTAQVEKFVAALEKGENVQTRLAKFGRHRTGQLGQFAAIGKEALKTTATEPTITQPVTGPIVDFSINHGTEEPLEDDRTKLARRIKGKEADFKQQRLIEEELAKEEAKVAAEQAKLEKERNATAARQKKLLEEERRKLDQEAAQAEKARIDAANAEQRRLLEEQEKAYREKVAAEKKIEDDYYKAEKERLAQAKANERTQDKEADRTRKEEFDRMRKQEEANRKAQADMLLRALEEETRINTPQKLSTLLPGGNVATQNVLSKVGKLDPKFNIDSLKSVTTEASTLISKLVFSYETLNGATKNATVFVDRWGRVLVDTQKRFRTFADNVIRDIAEVAKWSIAVAVVYGPVQKFSELMRDMVTIQTKLADVGVSLGDVQRSNNQIFADAYDIAQATGESVLGVVEAYNQAYRATGAIADETERFAATQQLLTDAIALSKLSGLTQAESIDILTAALKQAGLGLTEGTLLLNKWIAVSRIANVNMETLATTFAVVGDTAEAAGLSFDELNAIAASVAESSESTGKEVANATKAIIASFQSDATRRELDKLGISYQTVSGEARNFLDIAKEVFTLSKAGILTEEQMSALTLAQGGGPRRQPIVQAFYSSLEKLPDIINASSQAGKNSGEVQDALANKLNTVGTATEQLNNAFLSLAQSLGDKGGILDGFSGVLKLGTFLVDSFAKIADVGGKAIPVLIAVGAATAYITKQGQLWQLGAIGNIANFAGSIAGLDAKMSFSNMGRTAEQRVAYQEQARKRATDFVGGLPGTEDQMLKRFNIGASVAAGLLPALNNALQGNWGQAAGNSIGGAIGFAVSKSPVGVLVGSAIAEAFVNKVQEFKPDFKNLFEQPLFEPKKPEAPGTNAEELQKQVQEMALRALGNGSQFWGQIRGTLAQTVQNVAGQFEAWRNMQEFNPVDQSEASLVALQASQSNDLRAGLLSGRLAGRYAETITPEEVQEVLDLLRRANELAESKDPESEAVAQEFGDLLTKTQKDYEELLRTQLAAGEISVSGYKQGMENISGFNVRGSKYQAAFGEKYGSPQEAIPEFGRITAFGNKETLSTLNSYAETVISLDAELADLSVTDANYKIKLDERNEAYRLAIALINEMTKSLEEQRKLLNQVDLSEYSDNTAAEIIRRAQAKTQKDVGQNFELQGLTPEDTESYISMLEEIYASLEDGFTGVTRTTVQDIQEIIKAMEEAGEIVKKATNIGFQPYDMTTEQFNQQIGINNNAPGFQAFIDQLTALGYKEDRSEQIAIMTDGFIKPQAKDWRLVQYYLSEILKTEQKMAEGIYNLPEGSTAWLPYSAVKQWYGEGGNNTGTGMGTGVPTTTTETKESGLGLLNFAEVKALADYYERMYGNVDLPENTPSKLQADSDKLLGLAHDASPEGKLQSFSDGLLKLIEKYSDSSRMDVRDRTSTTMPDRVDTDAPTALDQFLQKVQEILIKLQTSIGVTPIGSPATGLGLGAGSTGYSLGARGGATIGTQIPEVSAKMNIDITSNSQLMLDGRIVANAVKRYLYADFIRFSAGGNSLRVSMV